jgi:hypothetical protein
MAANRATLRGLTEGIASITRKTSCAKGLQPSFDYFWRFA